MGDVRTHKKREVLTYMTGNADRIVTLEEIAKAVDWSGSSCSAALGTLIREFPLQMSRPARGVYRRTSAPLQPSQVPEVEPDEYLLEVVHRQGKKALVRDTSTGATYVLVPFDLDLG